MGNNEPRFTSIMLDEQDPNLATLKEYTEFWKIPYTVGHQASNASIIYSSRAGAADTIDKSFPTIITPEGTLNRSGIARSRSLRFVERKALIRVPIAHEATAAIRTQVYDVIGDGLEPRLVIDGTTVMCRLSGTQTYILAVDLVSEYSRLLHDRLDDHPSLRFRAVARIPLSYNAVPRFIRDRAFKSPPDSLNDVENQIGELEALRAIFLASIVELATFPVPRLSFWKRGKQFAFSITHDVESQIGLEKGAPHLLQVEKELGFRSTWNLPSERYPVQPRLARDLALSGEVGGHDTRHDGRLALLSPDNMVERLLNCRKELESRSNSRIRGFRAPLLQHNRNLLGAVGKAGFDFDSSVPSWEPLSPSSFKPHGVGTIFPFWINGVLEIPVSLIQDHQYLRVLGRSVSETVDSLLRVAKWIGNVGGACVLLVHPDYEFGFAENESEYRRLLEGLRDTDCVGMTLGELTDWWKFRTSAAVRIEDGAIRVEHNEGSPLLDEFGLQLVKGYGRDGFEVENLK